MVIEQHAYPIFDEDWGADEELCLVQGAEQCGLGNWQDISDRIGGRTKEEVEEHYKKVYLMSDSYPLPNMKRKFDISAEEFSEKKRKRLEERRSSHNMPLPKTKPTASVPACHEIQGYMPGRLEFDVEYENDAESVVKDMVFDPEDAPSDVNLKLTILDIYNSRLTSRAERKRTIFQHNLLDYRKHNAVDKKRTKEERDLMNKIRPFARIMTAKDFEDFSECIMTEYQCRRRIAELQEYRQAGIRTMAEAAKYERDKTTRLNGLARVGITPNTLLLPTSKYTGTSIPPAGYTSPNNQLLAKLEQSSSATNDNSTTSAANSANNSNNVTSTTATPTNNEGVNGHSDKLSNVKRLNSTNPLDISSAPDVDLLTPDERVLCSQLRIMPKPYLAIKETLFKELLKTGGVLKKKTAKELLKVDSNKTSRIYEFFQAQKWIYNA
jgi:transcriptional adapter 2-alpha